VVRNAHDASRGHWSAIAAQLTLTREHYLIKKKTTHNTHTLVLIVRDHIFTHSVSGSTHKKKILTRAYRVMQLLGTHVATIEKKSLNLIR